MSHEPLAMPIGALTRSFPSLSPIDSLARAAQFLREVPTGFLPVTEDGRLTGVLTDVALTRALAEGAEWTDPIQPLVEPCPETFEPHATGAEVLRWLGDSGHSHAVVVDREGYLVGVVGASDLYEVPVGGPRPHPIGGMATPFGVYLTNGSLRAGANDLALVSTGFTLFLCFLVASYFGEGLRALFPTFGHTAAGQFWFREVAPLAFFLVAFRTLPLAGIHAAEHKVVHAIERGEPLELEVVRRMPRVHPRCGTNLATGMSLFVGVWHTEWIKDDSIRFIAAAILTLILWRPLGNLIQFIITTRPPNDRQIMMGIKSGQELLEKYRTRRGRPPSIGRRLVMSGMFHAIAGSMSAGTLYFGLASLLEVLGFRLPL